MPSFILYADVRVTRRIEHHMVLDETYQPVFTARAIGECLQYIRDQGETTCRFWSPLVGLLCTLRLDEARTIPPWEEPPFQDPFPSS